MRSIAPFSSIAWISEVSKASLSLESAVRCLPCISDGAGWEVNSKRKPHTVPRIQRSLVNCSQLLTKVAQTAGAMGGVRWWWSQRDAHGPQQGGGIEMVCWDASLRWAGSRTHRDEGAGLPRPRPDVEWNLEFPRLGEYTGLYGSWRRSGKLLPYCAGLPLAKKRRRWPRWVDDVARWPPEGRRLTSAARRDSCELLRSNMTKMPLSEIKGKLQAVVFVCTWQKKRPKMSKKEKE